MKRTLREAAIDVLQTSAKQGQEPRHEGALGSSQPAAQIVDLGGATTLDPSGGPVGVKAAAARLQATAPKGPVVAAMPRHEGPLGSPQPQTSVKAEVQPTMATPSGSAPKPNGTEERTSDTGATKTDFETDKSGKQFHEELTAEEVAEAEAARKEMIISKIKELSVAEDVAAIFTGSDLSEEFLTRAKTIFEAAVVSRAVIVVEEMEKEIIKASEEAVDEMKVQLESQVDAYLDHMVTEWMTQNTIAIESGLKNEINEEFVSDLRVLFTKHNINIPEEQVNVVESLTQEVDALKAKVNEVLNNNVELNKKLNESKKLDLVSNVCEGLTATQTEKVKTLAEGVQFTTESEYRGKLQIIREQYFPVKTVKAETVTPNSVVINEGTEPATTVEVPAEMQNYVAALDKTLRR
jgi:hypothetical protein